MRPSLFPLATVLSFCACGARTGLFEPSPTPAISTSSPNPPVRNDCPDPNAIFVFVVTFDGQLYSFAPASAAFNPIGAVTCPDPGASPFSMAVDRHGNAYVEYDDGNLFLVDVHGPGCSATAFLPNQAGFFRFGMGFATNAGGPSETLFIAQGDETGNKPELGVIETSTLTASALAPLPPPLHSPELTGTGDGRLFAFSADSPDSQAQGAFVAQIDKSTGKIVAQTDLPSVTLGVAWAFAFWGGDFYLFTTPATHIGSAVTRFRPADGSVSVLTRAPFVIVGAGVSTCAPQ